MDEGEKREERGGKREEGGNAGLEPLTNILDKNSQSSIIEQRLFKLFFVTKNSVERRS
jgi:hypothetical protein